MVTTRLPSRSLVRKNTSTPADRPPEQSEAVGDPYPTHQAKRSRIGEERHRHHSEKAQIEPSGAYEGPSPIVGP